MAQRLNSFSIPAAAAPLRFWRARFVFIPPGLAFFHFLIMIFAALQPDEVCRRFTSLIERLRSVPIVKRGVLVLIMLKFVLTNQSLADSDRATSSHISIRTLVWHSHFCLIDQHKQPILTCQCPRISRIIMREPESFQILCASAEILGNYWRICI